jgi:hypothetical protein
MSSDPLDGRLRDEAALYAHVLKAAGSLVDYHDIRTANTQKRASCKPAVDTLVTTVANAFTTP